MKDDLWIENAAKRLDIPLQLAVQYPQVMINGFGEVCVDGVKRLLTFSREEIAVRVKCGVIRICGTQLGIDKLQNSQAVIRGKLKTVELIKEGEGA